MRARKSLTSARRRLTGTRRSVKARSAGFQWATGNAHRVVTFLMVNQIGLAAASSLANAQRILLTLRMLRWRLSTALMERSTRRTSGGSAKKGLPRPKRGAARAPANSAAAGGCAAQDGARTSLGNARLESIAVIWRERGMTTSARPSLHQNALPLKNDTSRQVARQTGGRLPRSQTPWR